MWRDLVLERDKEGKQRVNRVNYELCVLDALQRKALVVHITYQPVEKLSVELFLLSKEKLNSWRGESSTKSYRLFLS